MQETAPAVETKTTTLAEMASDPHSTVTRSDMPIGRDKINILVKPSMIKEGDILKEKIIVPTVPYESDAAPANTEPVKAQETTDQKTNEIKEPAKEIAKETKSDEQLETEYQKKFAQQFSILAKREKEITEKEKQYKEMTSKFKDYEDSKKKAIEDPDAYLAAVGLDYNMLTEFYLKGKTPEAAKIKKLETEIERIEKQRLEELEKIQKDNDAAELNKKIEAAKTFAKKEIIDSGNKFETINALGQYETVFEVIQAAYENDGTILTNIEAAEKVEEALKEELRQNMDRLKNISYMREYFYKPDTANKPETTQSKTLTNGMSQVTTNLDRARELSRLSKTEESLREAAKLIKFT